MPEQATLPDDFKCTCGVWWEPVNVIAPGHEPDCALVGHPLFTGEVKRKAEGECREEDR